MRTTARLWRSIEVPAALRRREVIGGRGFDYAGDLRLGDLRGDGRGDLLVYRSRDGGMKPAFLAALDLDGHVLWTVGDPALAEQPNRPGSVAIHDLDGDGRSEVVCCWREPATPGTPDSLANVRLQLRDGATGEVKHEAAPPALTACRGSGPNWVHQRLLIANLRGLPTPRDIVVKLGAAVLAFDDRFNLLWRYDCPWTEYSRCPSYIPAVGDIDGDGADEVTGGYYLIDHDGTVLWEKQWARNMDSVAIVPWDHGRVRAICSGGGHVIDAAGNAVLALGERTVPHGQEVRVANFDPETMGPDMIVRYNGHTPEVLLANSIMGRVVRRWELNPNSNNTGMEPVWWHGPEAPALLHNAGCLWDGHGRCLATLPGLPPAVGPRRVGEGPPGGRMSWYHCIAADVCGDEREELILWNPWDRCIFIYTPGAPDDPPATYSPGPRQYNPRIMD